MTCKLEAEDFSAKLGVFPPESFARIKWLLEVSKFLYESPMPEAYWLTNQDIDKLLSEAKAYNQTAIWIKDTRISLAERYNPSLFNLPFNTSTEIKQELEALGKMLPSVALEDSEFLHKQDKFLAFLKSTQSASKKWR